ncbi:hypothetical protein FOMPIDRAFT_1121428 [Fomitopsis schrenkii]|uniref:AB hydrolase-1 domain-containing protein n=1 Tax=Fomitopsis schrenkii TaxID=2126942 RepID=S8FHU5_FOMSC|nr:hypothetical protein FOMPIDRAFT_1121428 [Fomitopsis schrenkii]
MGFDEGKLDLPVADHGAGHRPGHQRRSWRRALCIKLILLFGAVCAIRALSKRRCTTGRGASERHRGTPSASLANPDFDWFSLTPSEDIHWTPCYDDESLCARLILPLDYLSPPGHGPNATIAMLLLLAEDQANVRGTILVNPGGPGGAGTDLVRRSGKKIRRITGGSFNILGFDPRGIGASTPSAQCFDSVSQAKIWGLQAGHHSLNLSDDSVPLARAREIAHGTRCEGAIGGIGKEDANGTAQEWGAARFMSTASVATDMLKITEKLGEDKLKYWGFSYGTILGQFFSAMYPDKVGRVVIDGVFDSHNYRNASWNTNLIDTDAVWASLPTFCHQAGPSKCVLYRDTPEAIEARIEAIMEGIKQQPLAVPFAPSGPYVITYRALHYYAFQAMYNPVATFPALSRALIAIEQNNQTALEGLEETFGAGVKCQCDEPSPWVAESDAFHAIACGDGEPVTYTKELYRTYFENLEATSKFAAPYWGRIFLRCTEWPIRPKWRYTGPLAAPNTSHPLLIVSPRYDTVCPLSDAERVHERYSSGLLVQNSYGHCSLAAPSLCTAKYVREYFEDGTLPEEGTVCEVDELPFIGAVNGEANAMSVEDQELLDALRGLGEAIPMMGAF